MVRRLAARLGPVMVVTIATLVLAAVAHADRAAQPAQHCGVATKSDVTIEGKQAPLRWQPDAVIRFGAKNTDGGDKAPRSTARLDDSKLSK